MSLKEKMGDLENNKTNLERQVERMKTDQYELEQDYKSQVRTPLLSSVLIVVLVLLQLAAKTSELESIRDDLEKERHKYEDMLGTKLALDTEIAVYKALLDGEEKRVARF